MPDLFGRLRDAFHAWRRGEVRIAPAGVRGRVYAKTGSGSSVLATVTLKPDMAVRVFRVAENAWYRQNEKTGMLEKE